MYLTWLFLFKCTEISKIIFSFLKNYVFFLSFHNVMFFSIVVRLNILPSFEWIVNLVIISTVSVNYDHNDQQVVVFSLTWHSYVPLSLFWTYFICSVQSSEPSACNTVNRSSFVYVNMPEVSICQSLRRTHEICEQRGQKKCIVFALVSFRFIIVPIELRTV